MTLIRSKSFNLFLQTLAIALVCFIFLAFTFESQASQEGAVSKKPESDKIIGDPDTINKDEQVQQILGEAKLLTPLKPTRIQGSYEPTFDELSLRYGITRDQNKEKNIGHALLAKIYADKYGWEEKLKEENLYEAMIFFITYDYGTTADLGAGERAGVINSWKSSKQLNGICIPEEINNWQDIIKIANGRWPNVLPQNDYLKSKENVFRKIYLRNPDYSNKNDEIAMLIIAYGLRPYPRNVNSEKEALNSFKQIYQRNPLSASDWDIVRTIAYSGAVR